MSFNKPKSKRNAERYLTQGKIQAAISEYRQIVDHDPKDVNTRNILGDLYAKASNAEEAVKCYEGVAEFYNSQGFAKKAIAIYNKIYRIEPDSMEVSSKLAELYRMRGSYAEAKKHYETLAAHYESKGHRIEALAIWENIAELDPQNAEIYLKIADSYWQDERKNEAADAFIKAGKRLAESANHESAVAAYSRALEISQLDLEAMEGLVRSQIELGYPEEAVKTLEKRIEGDPYDKASNFLLVDCYYDMDDPASAERVIVKMVERDPSNYRKFLDLVDVYLKADDLDAVVRVLSMITEHMLVSGENETLLELLEEVLARNPEHLAALRLLTRYHGWMKDELELKAALDRVLESARLNESFEDERYALSQLILLVPHDKEISDRLAELGGTEDGFQSYVPANDKQSGEVPEFESYAVLSDDTDSSDDGFKAVENQKADNMLTEQQETGYSFANSGEGEFAGHDGEDTVEAEIVADDIFGEEGTRETERVESVTEDRTGETVKNDEIRSEADAAQEVAVSELNAADEMRLDEELESIRFYLDQGYSGLANKSITELEREFGNRPEIVELRIAHSGDSQTVETDSVSKEPYGQAVEVEAANVESVDSASVDEDALRQDRDHEAAAANSDVNKVVTEISGEIVNKDIRETEAVEGTTAARQQDPVKAATETEESVEADQAPEPIEPNEASDSNADSTGTGKHGDTNSFENFRDELGLGDFDREVDVGFDNHYQHAVAYQEMGLMEEAIHEYQEAVNTISPDDGTHRFLNCCALLGHCFMEKGMPNLGVVWFKRAFETPELTSDELNGLHYELGNAYEADGESELALAEFEKIYLIAVDFRDVGDRIEKLREMSPANA